MGYVRGMGDVREWKMTGNGICQGRGYVREKDTSANGRCQGLGMPGSTYIIGTYKLHKMSGQPERYLPNLKP